jgi:hypothetical protein
MMGPVHPEELRFPRFVDIGLLRPGALVRIDDLFSRPVY